MMWGRNTTPVSVKPNPCDSKATALSPCTVEAHSLSLLRTSHYNAVIEVSIIEISLKVVASWPHYEKHLMTSPSGTILHHLLCRHVFHFWLHSTSADKSTSRLLEISVHTNLWKEKIMETCWIDSYGHAWEACILAVLCPLGARAL